MIKNEIEKRIIIKLDDVCKEKRINKHQLCQKIGLRYETIQNYYMGKIYRVDLYIIAEFCENLNCDISDLFEFIPNKKS